MIALNGIQTSLPSLLSTNTMIALIEQLQDVLKSDNNLVTARIDNHVHVHILLSFASEA